MPERQREQQQKKETSISCRKTVTVKVEGKVIQASFRKVEGRGTLVGAKDRTEKGQIEKLVDNQNRGPEAPPRGRKALERRVQRKGLGRSIY